MRKPRLSIAMGYIDDDLVSGAIEYMPKKAQKGVCRKWVKWRGIAACLCLAVAAVIVISRLQITPNISAPGPIIDNTGTISQGDPTIDDPTVSQQISVAFNETNTVPNMLLPFFSEENCIPMSNEELGDYYGIELQGIVPEDYTEADSCYQHGLYAFENGVFDMNLLVFASGDGTKEIHIYIGKITRCGEYASGFNTETADVSIINGTEMYIYHVANAADTCHYAVFEHNGCDLFVVFYNVEEETFVDVLGNLTSN